MTYFEGENIGGIAKTEIAFHTDFASFNPAVFKPGKNWISIPFKEQSANLQPGQGESKNGTIYGYSGKFFFNRLRGELETDLNPFIGQFSVIRLTDMNGEIYIIGAPGYPVMLDLSANTGTAVTNENGVAYSFSVQQSFPHFKA